ncbi:MAG: calcium-binding protein [Merismopedia sp. SIO2A8]|nr:calcium-binding protein [Merismopedia sp. SIO2A8]
MIGNSDRNIIRGKGDGDVIFARGGNDRVFGNGGDDIIRAGAGNDKLDGGAGDDVLLGGRGDDRLCGRAGDDVLRGGGGNDTLIGGRGQDVMTGNSGADIFRLRPETTVLADADIVTDFNPAAGDRIKLPQNIDPQDLDILSVEAIGSGGNTVILMYGAQILGVVSVTANNADDPIFIPDHFV